MDRASFIVFVCEHGAAKSIIAAAYFNKLASEEKLDVRAIARGTNPDPELSPNTVAGLSADGLSPAESVPQKLLLVEARSARHIVTFCELPGEHRSKVPVEQWNDIPPVSENYAATRDAILSRLGTIMEEMKSMS